MKLLTITVPCYNSQEYMRFCIDSLLAGGERVEIIIIDDGSTDRTGEIADMYAEKYPEIVKVIHQENKGHGGGINSGIKHASGKYFKVVDSDDSLDKQAFEKVLDSLEVLEADLVVTNYKYCHDNVKWDKVIKYTRPLPCNKVIGWQQTRRFKPEQYLTIHSVIYKTDKIIQSGVELPNKVFYEDNTFVYTVLPTVEKILYLDVDLYNYTIGREGQSVQENVIKKRYSHQILAATTIFKLIHLDSIENKKLKRYLYHECVMMLLIATIFTRLNKTQQAENDIEQMWTECMEFDAKYAKRIRKFSLAMWVSLEGKTGRQIGIILYKFARKIVRFN